MPSERMRPRDDTWTSEELNKALKGSKDDMLRKKRADRDGDRRHHNDDMNGSSHKRDPDRRSRHRDENDKRSRQHKDRGDSPDIVPLTEDERERLRQERRAKREGTKEEKKSRLKEHRSVKALNEDDDDDIQNVRHRDRDDGHRSEKRHYRSEESQKHRDEKDKERRRHHDERERKSHQERGDADEGRRKHHKEESVSSRRHHDEADRPRHSEQSRERRHASDKESRHRSHRNKDDDDDDNAERERRRQERRERREQEMSKDRDREKEKEQGKQRRTEKKDHSSTRYSQDVEVDRDENGDHSQDRHTRRKHRDKDWDLEVGHKSEKKKKSQHNDLDKEDGVKTSSSRHTTNQPKFEHSKAGSDDDEDHEDNDNEYNYEEDFEDYEDDFEDEDAPKTKEEIEMEGLLKALDEENRKASHRSDRLSMPKAPHREDMYDEQVTQTKSRSKTFINFVSAKQRALNYTVASKARKRFDDLSKLIELDVAKYDMFDLPPVKEYELYIRNYGRSDTKQAYVQTGDDDVERDVQTEEVESFNKWTQHPPSEDIAVGGEGINVYKSEDSPKIFSKTDNVRLNQFLDRVSQFIFAILDEESSDHIEESKKQDDKLAVSFCKSSSQLGMPNFLIGRQVMALSFCQSEPNYLLSVHSPTDNGCEGQSPLQDLYVACVWNLTQPVYPHRICGSKMKITCACFSPAKALLVFAGMYDGSVALWDLREPVSLHRHMKVDMKDHLVRFPTYNTAGVADLENHYSPVVSIVPVSSNLVGSLKDKETTESSSGLSFQLASVEEKGIINLWVVMEASTSDPAGSETDLGLAPGGRIKLLRSSAIMLNNPNKYLSTSTELRALDLSLDPGDLNHFYMATDIGSVVHCVRFGKKAYPRCYSCPEDSPVPVVSIDFSPFGHGYFLAGCQDGTLHLFKAKMEKPITSWQNFVKGDGIKTVRWSQSRPAVFYVLDNNSEIFTFDLIENGLGPIKMDRITSAKASAMEVGGDPNLMTNGISRPAYMVVGLDSGVTEILTVCDEMRQQHPLEEDFLATYADRY